MQVKEHPWVSEVGEARFIKLIRLILTFTN